MARVYVTRPLPGTALDRLAAEHEVAVWPKVTPVPRDELLQQAARADGLLTMVSDRIDHELLAQAPTLRVIANYAVGFDNIDVRTAVERGMSVGNTPDVLTDATADLTWALLMACARHVVSAVQSAREGGWLTWDPGGFLGADVHGATLGIIGHGRIGRAVAARAAGFSMEVIATTGRSTPEEVDQLLRTADFVSLHAPLTDRTRRLIDADALARMRPTAILINTARGAMVDHPALLDALQRGQIAGAGLDVTDPEPLPATHPLFRCPGVVITPHIGSATHTARRRMAELCVENLLAGLAGEALPYPVPAP